MREILFRGKKIDNDEWTYGFYFEHSIDGQKDSYIKYQTFDEGFVTNEVIADTVGQFTGLTDKNGKKIFEGDIVRYGKGIYEWNKKDWEFEVGIIDFKDGAFIINDIYSNDGYNELSCLYHEINYSGEYDSGTLLEVIGNIHDNPELLEGGRMINKDTYKRLTAHKLTSFYDWERENLKPEQSAEIYDRLADLEDKIENRTLVELGYHIRKSYRNHDDQRYKIILIDEVEIDKIGYDGLTKAEAEARLKELQEEYKWNQF